MDYLNMDTILKLVMLKTISNSMLSAEISGKIVLK